MGLVKTKQNVKSNNHIENWDQDVKGKFIQSWNIIHYILSIINIIIEQACIQSSAAEKLPFGIHHNTARNHFMIIFMIKNREWYKHHLW